MEREDWASGQSTCKDSSRMEIRGDCRRLGGNPAAGSGAAARGVLDLELWRLGVDPVAGRSSAWSSRSWIGGRLCRNRANNCGFAQIQKIREGEAGAAKFQWNFMNEGSDWAIRWGLGQKWRDLLEIQEEMSESGWLYGKTRGINGELEGRIGRWREIDDQQLTRAPMIRTFLDKRAFETLRDLLKCGRWRRAAREEQE